MKLVRPIEAMTGGTALVESMHGAGSPQAQRIMMYRESDIEKKIKLAKALLGIRQRKKASRNEGNQAP
jgi:4-hydroxybutyryl-CoA dehydratase/vinylacetyl-CoA-Delta-isomerase